MIHTRPDPASPESVHADNALIAGQVRAYLQQLGIQEPQLLEKLTEDCLYRARRRLSPHAPRDEILRRALEEGQRMLDRSIAHLLDLPINDVYAIARVRAALLFSGEPCDFLFAAQQSTEGHLQNLLAKLPQHTPEESHLQMVEQPISFFFSARPEP